MASHPHHHSCHTNHLSSCSCCCSCNSSNPSQFSQSPTTDPLLQALAAQLLQSSQTHLYAQYLKPQQHEFHQKHLYQKQQQHQQTQSLLSSLLRRIEVLESSLHQIPASPPPHPPITTNSLRHIAARIIQTHFRAFLVRRSRTLRQLKDLAFIKASLNSLKSSISDGSQLKPEALLQKAMDLLLKLDSIQGGDPMIRDGKKSVTRDLVRFLEFVDGLSTKRRELSSKANKSLRPAENSKKSRVCLSINDPVMATYYRDLSGEQREILEKLSNQAKGISENKEGRRHVELESFHQISDDEDDEDDKDDPKRPPNHGGILVKRRTLGSKSKKNVSFAENGDLTKVFDEAYSGGHEAGIDQRFPDADQRELIENLCREVEEIGLGGFSGTAGDDEEVEENSESKGFHQAMDGDRNPRRILQREVNYGKMVQCQGQNGEIAFSAPLPVQMEPIIREVRGRR